MEPIEGSETSDFKPQTPGKYPKENIPDKEHGESLNSRNQRDYSPPHNLVLWIRICGRIPPLYLLFSRRSLIRHKYFFLLNGYRLPIGLILKAGKKPNFNKRSEGSQVRMLDK